MLPIDKLGRILTLAMVDPLDGQALATIREHCPDLKIKPILCDWDAYHIVSQQLFSDGSERDQVSASAFGLTEKASKPKPQPTPQPDPSAEAAAPSTANPMMEEAPAPSRQTAPQAAAAPFDPAPLVAALRDGLRESQQATVAALAEAIRESAALSHAQNAAPSEAPQAAPAPDLAAMARSIKESVRGALSEGLAEMTERLAETRAPRPEAAPAEAAPAALVAQGPSIEEVARAMQESISAAMRESAEGMKAAIAEASAAAIAARPEPPAEAPAAAAPPPPPPAPEMPSAAEIAEAVQSAVAQAIAPLAEMQTKAPEPAPHPTVQDNGSAEANAELTAAVQLAAQSISEAVQSVNGQRAEQDSDYRARMDDIRAMAEQVTSAASAALHAAQAASTARDASSEAAAIEAQSRRARFNTVRAFGENGTAQQEAASADDKVRAALDANAPLTQFTFESFVVSESNAFSAKACQAVAQAPGGDYNPLFVYGPVGIGKTHIINAAGNAVLGNEQTKHLRVGYAAAGRFAQKLLEAMHENAGDAFRDAYCQWDVLILDDIQFLGGHVEAQEEFFHIFNALYQEGRQIIIAADKAPDALGHLEQRLISRFSAGIVTQLQPPDYPSRVRILEAQAQHAKAKLQPDVAAMIATRIPNDVRKMCGALRKVIAFGGLVGQDITCDMAYQALDHLDAAGQAV